MQRSRSKGGEAKAKNAKQSIANARNANECLADCSISTYTEPKPITEPKSITKSKTEHESKSSNESNQANTEYITADAADVPRPDAKGIDALTAEQPIIGFFYQKYKEHTGKNHPSVSMPKLIEISETLSSNEADESFVNEYFGDESHKGLCGNSDCSIFHFASPAVQEILTDRLK